MNIKKEELLKCKNEKEINEILKNIDNLSNKTEILSKLFNVKLIEVSTEKEYKEAYDHIIKTKILNARII